LAASGWLALGAGSVFLGEGHRGKKNLNTWRLSKTKGSVQDPASVGNWRRVITGTEKRKRFKILMCRDGTRDETCVLSERRPNGEVEVRPKGDASTWTD